MRYEFIMFACIFTFHQRGKALCIHQGSLEKQIQLCVCLWTDWLVDFKELAVMITYTIKSKIRLETQAELRSQL